MEFWKPKVSQLFSWAGEPSHSYAETDALKKLEASPSATVMKKTETRESVARDEAKQSELERIFLHQMSEFLMKESVEHAKFFEPVFQKRSYRAEGETSVSVAQEVLKREIMIALESIRRPRNQRSHEDERLIEKQRLEIDSLKDQLQKASGRANAAEENVALLLKENHSLTCACQEREERNSELSKKLDKLSGEQKILADKVNAWTTLSEQWEARALQQQEAKIAAKARVLRAEHKAKLAELRANHAASQSVMLEKRLEEANSFSTAVFQRVEELRKLQARILRSLASQSQRAGGFFSGSPTQLLRRGPNFLRRLWASIPLTKHRETSPAEQGKWKTEDDREAVLGEPAERDVNGVGAEPGTPYTFRLEGSRGIFSVKAIATQNSRSTTRDVPPQDYIAKTLGVLMENLESLREVIEVKQHEVDRLHRELRAATLQANTFERRLSEEKHKLREMEHIGARPVRSKSYDISNRLDRNGTCNFSTEHAIVTHQSQRCNVSLREDRLCANRQRAMLKSKEN